MCLEFVVIHTFEGLGLLLQFILKWKSWSQGATMQLLNANAKEMVIVAFAITVFTLYFILICKAII